jgi:hypothetical protein
MLGMRWRAYDSVRVTMRTRAIILMVSIGC